MHGHHSKVRLCLQSTLRTADGADYFRTAGILQGACHVFRYIAIAAAVHVTSIETAECASGIADIGGMYIQCTAQSIQYSDTDLGGGKLFRILNTLRSVL